MMPGSITAHGTKRLPVGVAFQFWAWALILRPLKHVIPLHLLVRLVRSRRQSRRRLVLREAAILDYMTANDRFPWRAPANCLERSLAAYRLLAAAGAAPELRVGVRRVADSQAVDGHVWVVVDGQPIAEAAGFAEQFTAVLRFNADGSVQRLGHAGAETPSGPAISAP
jgi:hypothetical protein